MSRSTSHPASITGHAVVRLKTGVVYVGHAVYDGRAITIDGSLRVIELVGDTSIFTYRPPLKRTVPLHLIREVVWDDDVRRMGEHADTIPQPNGEDADDHTYRTAGRQQAS